MKNVGIEDQEAGIVVWMEQALEIYYDLLSWS